MLKQMAAAGAAVATAPMINRGRFQALIVISAMGPTKTIRQKSKTEK
jgi:hypothetical protein